MAVFRAEGRKIIKEPVKTRRPEGGTTITMSFPVLEVTDWVSDPEHVAKMVAETMSSSPLFE